MTVSEHPELEQLKNYLNNSASAEFSGLRLHLAQCSQCRALIDGLTGLEQVSQQVLSMQTERDTLSEQQHQKIADYIDGRLSGDEHLQIKEFLQLNPLAMKAALHYASHSSAMDKAGLESTTDTISVATTGMAVNLVNRTCYCCVSGYVKCHTARPVTARTVKVFDCQLSG